uniref:Hemerythrin-like domain-containing protein n=1 Tax=Pseudo-nitzschia australis TaxID=44445 RepID=A0A6U9ZBN9_9STRA|mmetsp:Transcript_16818/g.35068  ORF Transcript_16818/g.35068 Transcript_16818/m.35068 type:complete len:277 (-) Transcript_16818:1032-1862(-)
MQKWAATIPSVQFACVCVESAQVAAAFHRMFRFDEAPLLVNCYIPSRNYMPVGYGQLGCSGFVVSDAKGNFVSRKTMAYLQHGERAFGFVESLLEDLVPDLYGVNDHCNYSNQHSNINGNGNGNSNDSDNNNDNDSNNNNSNKQKRKTATKATTATTTSATRTTIKPPESVGVDAMDEEHRICTDSFNRAAKDPTVETLEELHDILKSHFDHEEELISKHTSSKGSFSSLDSHRMDHQRILRIAAAELGRVAAAATTSSCTTLPDACGMTQGGRKE